ncbi:glycosyltransferase family 2 protein [Sphingobacterium suaedae]|uniref:Glycosyltransferase family 2 protein n=1 Tax=Sphingobacterium suaedae TaxID=1686402 RepID=A0ABW5KLN8_9SPHI
MKKRTQSNSPLVSIIVPVYNAEKTLPGCLASLAKQTYVELELIFVDDCSSDNTSLLLQDFGQQQDGRIRVLRHKKNKGVAAARNSGLDLATGVFIYYVDADDRIEPNAIAVLVEAAQENNAEIVGCNWFLSFASGERKMNQPSFSDPWGAISQMLAGNMRWNLWLFLTARALYDDFGIRFTEGMNMGEDLMVMVRLFSQAERVVHVDKALYHYEQTNGNSLTKVYSLRHREEVTFHVDQVERCLKNSRFKHRLGSSIDLLKFHIKLPFLISDKGSSYRIWMEWFPEINYITDMGGRLSIRLRVLRWAALQQQYWLLQLHYFMLTRVVYGLIYK